MGGFDEIVISALLYEKINICSFQKYILIIKINISVHPDGWCVLSESIIYYY